MATKETSAAKPKLSVSVEERIFAPLRANVFAARTWFSVTLVAILLIHGAFLAWMLWRDVQDPVRVAQAEETPVEVVVEQPKPPAPQPPPPSEKQEIEKPATSAPRAPNEQKVETEQNDTETHAPKAAAPPTDGKPEKAEQAAAPDESQDAKQDETEESAPKPQDVLKKDAEALDKAVPEPPRKPEAIAKAKPVAKRRAKTAFQQLAGASDLPDYKFAKPMRKKAKIFGGTEDDRYLAVVYGLIMQNRMPVYVPGGEWEVAVAFQVDGEGNLVGLGIQESSGYTDVDAQAIAQVQRAAPFPPPPRGAPHGLLARLRSSNVPADPMRMGER